MAEQKPFTLEEYEALVSSGGSSKQGAAPVAAPSQSNAPPTPPSSKSISTDEYEQLTQPKAAPQIGFGEDFARSLGAGAGRGAIGLTGLAGDVESLYDLAKEKITGKKPGERYFPTSAEMTEKAKTAFPAITPYLDYKPEYDINKYAKTAGEFLPSAIIPGGGLSLGARAAGSVGAGLATQATENALKGTPLEGTGWETGAKVAASIPGFMAGTRATSALQSVAGGTLPFRAGAEAERRIVSEMGKDVALGGKYGAPMTPSAVAETGVEIAPAALAGKNTQKLLEGSASRVAPEVAGAYETAVAPLRQEAPGRLKQYVNELLDIQNDTRPFEDIAAIRSRASQVNNQNYARVMQLPQANQIGGQQLDQVVSQLPQGTIAEVADNLRQWGLNPSSIGLIQTRGGFQLNPAGMPLRFWDEVKQNLDQKINALKNPLNGQIMDRDAFARYNNTNSMLKSALDSSVPEYAAIRGAAAEAAGAANAIELGMNYLKTSDAKRLNFIETTRNKLNPAQQKDFATGVAGAYKDLLDRDPQAAMNLFSGSKGGDRVRRLNQALSPLGNNLGHELVGRANAELLNSRIASLRPSSGVDWRGLLPYAPGATGAALQLAETVMQGALWSGNPTALATTLATIGAGKLFNMKEARVASKVLEYMSDPRKMKQLGKLIEQDAYARSFIGKTYNILGRAVLPAEISDVQRQERASGGRVGAGAIAQKLVLAAEKAHKYHQKTTEEILDAPDEHVVKALAVANKHI